MATMIPEDIGEFKTEGEKRFYCFLEAVAKPDSKYTIRYLPEIEGREPDFVLFCEEVGLIIFDVKDWELSQIQEATLRSFVLAMGREKRRKTALISASPKSASTAALWSCKHCSHRDERGQLQTPAPSVLPFFRELPMRPAMLQKAVCTVEWF